jgi:hypothetical protein
MGLATVVDELRTLILSFHPIIIIETVEEERVQQVLQTLAPTIPLPLFEWSVTRGLVRLPCKVGRPLHGTTEPLLALGNMAEYRVEAIFCLQDFVPHLSDPQVARKLRELARQFSQTRSTMILTGASVTLPAELHDYAVRYTLPRADTQELRQMVKAVLTSLKDRQPVKIDLQPWQMEELLRALQGMTVNQARQALAHAILVDGALSADDIPRILERKAQAIHAEGLLEYYPVTEPRMQLGGFQRLQAWMQRAQMGFTPQAQALNLPAPKGILLVGVQGCGKSLAAKVIAQEWGMPLVKLDLGRLYDKYVGESEKNLRRALLLAASLAPVVLWVDELEKGVGSATDTDTGVSQRFLGTLLTWMQEKTQPVFIVATANDLTRLPPELLRKGRFDEIFFVDLPDEAERKQIWEIHLSYRKQQPSQFDLNQLVCASEGFSGAEIEQVVVAGLYRALYLRKALDTGLLLEELQQTIPLSVSRREDIEHLRQFAQGRFTPVR